MISLPSFMQYEKPSLEPLIAFAKLFGMWWPERSRIKAIMFHGILAFMITYFVAVVTYTILNFKFNLLIQFMEYSLFHLCLTKMALFALHHEKWEKVIQRNKDIEIESTAQKDSKHAKIINKYKYYSHLFTIAYCTTCTVVTKLFYLGYWISNVLIPESAEIAEGIPLSCIFHAWLPFDQDATRFGRHMSGVLQTMYGICNLYYSIIWDSFMLTFMIMFAGQLKGLRARCVHALDCVDDEQNWQKLIKCHQQHNAVLKNMSEFNSLIAPVTFVHILIISIVSAILIIKIALVESTTSELIRTVDFLAGINSHLVLFYAISNEVIVQSERLSYGVFESQWVERSVRVRRAVLILSSGMQQPFAFKAGPFSDMSLRTLISILKGSYSFYTLFSQTTNAKQ